ncbi:hypothetical protein N9Z02_01525 [Akkermansiaceae bacterium]|nr:hypothetical protein [Akkermansiaceae bacterium]
MFRISIEGYSLGSRKRPKLFEGFSVPVPPTDPGDSSMTLRMLIERIVRHEVAEFEKRQNSRQFLRALSKSEIAAATESGKIESGESEIDPVQIDPVEAVDIALQAFVDGLYLVVIDDEEKRDLDEQIFLQPESRVTFLRLTLLSG